MNISERQQRYGALWGAIAFGIGVAVAWHFLPESVGQSPDRFKRAIWLYLSSHYFAVGPIQVENLVSMFPRLGIVETGSRPDIWYVIPILSSALGAIGVNETLGRSSDHERILRNGALMFIGYIPIAVAGIVWSEATPSIGIFVVIVAVAFLALAVGSSVLGETTRGTPVFAVTSLWGLLGIGLLILLGGYVLVRILIPVAVAAAGGAILGSGVTYVARNY